MNNLQGPLLTDMIAVNKVKEIVLVTLTVFIRNMPGTRHASRGPGKGPGQEILQNFLIGL